MEMATRDELLSMLTEMKEVKRRTDTVVSRLEALLSATGGSGGRSSGGGTSGASGASNGGVAGKPEYKGAGGGTGVFKKFSPMAQPAKVESRDSRAEQAELAHRARRQSQHGLTAASKAKDVREVVQSTLDQTPMAREQGLKVSVWDIHTNHMEVSGDLTFRFNRSTEMFTLDQPSSFMDVFRGKVRLPVTSFHLTSCKCCYAGAEGAEEEEELCCFTMELIVRRDDETTEEIHLAFRVDEGGMQDRDATVTALGWLKAHVDEKQERGGVDPSSPSPVKSGGGGGGGIHNEGGHDRLNTMDELFGGGNDVLQTPLKDSIGHQADFSGMTRIAEVLDSGMVNPLANQGSMNAQEVIRRGSLSAASRALLLVNDEEADNINSVGEVTIDDAYYTNVDDGGANTAAADTSYTFGTSGSQGGITMSANPMGSHMCFADRLSNPMVNPLAKAGVTAAAAGGGSGGALGLPTTSKSAKESKMAGLGSKRRDSKRRSSLINDLPPPMRDPSTSDTPEGGGGVQSPTAKNVLAKSSAAMSAAEELLQTPMDDDDLESTELQ